MKTILGGTLRGRNFPNQETEAKILNKMAPLSMPNQKVIFNRFVEEKTAPLARTRVSARKISELRKTPFDQAKIE